MGHLRQNGHGCLAPQHAEEDDSTEDPQLAEKYLDLVQQVGVRDVTEDGACDDDHELRLEQRPRAEAHGHELVAGSALAQREGEERDREDHQEGLDGGAVEDLRASDLQLCTPRNQPTACGPEDRCTKHCGHDAEQVREDDDHEIRVLHIGRRGDACEDPEEREYEGCLQRAPHEDQARQWVSREAHTELLHLRDDEAVAQRHEDRADDDRLLRRIIQAEMGANCDADYLEGCWHPCHHEDVQLQVAQADLQAGDEEDYEESQFLDLVSGFENLVLRDVREAETAQHHAHGGGQAQGNEQRAEHIATEEQVGDP
mmetsp:Transcript_136854/g.355168  ORF Transcript_136854/g.355168 Transcript_136854/m.355168 type:complete len:314 (-) Transcript_136854:45-986(-)